MSLITIREMQKDDVRFICASFFESFLKSLKLSDLPFEVFQHGMNVRIARLLKRSTVRVACATAEPSIIIGYALVDFENGAVHWCYVKSPFRRQGIGSQLISGHLREYTHRPAKEGHAFARHHNMQYNPRAADPAAPTGNTPG